MPVITSPSMTALQNAQLSQADTRLVMQGGHVQEKGDLAHKPYFWQFSQKKARKQENIASANALMQALCSQYGQRRGQIIFSEHIGLKALQGADIHTSSVKGLLRDLHDYDTKTDRMAQSLCARMQAVASAYHRPVHELTNALGRGVSTRFERLCHKASMAMSDFPHSVAELQTSLDTLHALCAEANNLSDFLQNCIDTTPTFADGYADVQQDVQSMLAAAQAKIAEHEASLRHCPNVAGNVRKSFQQYYDAAIATLVNHLPPSVAQNPAQNATVNALLDKLDTTRSQVLADLQDTDTVDSARMAAGMTLSKALIAEIYKELKAIIPISRSAFAKEFATEHRAQLDGDVQAWKPIIKPLHVEHGGQPQTYTSVITPRVDAQGHGINCHSFTSRHAVNCAVSTLKDATGRPLFTGIRHGVHSAIELPPAERRAANRQRAKESVLQAFLAKPELWTRQQPVELPMISISLLTPDAVRHGIAALPGTSSINDERAMLLEQQQAWQDLVATSPNGTIELEVPSGPGTTTPVTVRPVMMQCNFGVNTGAQHSMSVAQSTVGGWSVSEPMNDTALAAFTTMVQSRLHAWPQDTRRAQAEDLLRQITAMHTSGAYRQSGQDPYAMPARMAVLADMVGIIPFYNCKSGKDRTGQMDVACKTLAIQLAQGNAPHYTAPPTTEDMALRAEVVLNGGNHELQQANTSFMGFKTKGVAGLDKQFMPGVRDTMMGLSNWVKV